jgi:hypothetical protein
MLTAESAPALDRDDLLAALDFVEAFFNHAAEKQQISPAVVESLVHYYQQQRELVRAGKSAEDFQLRPANVCWSCKETFQPRHPACASCGAPVLDERARRLRLLICVCFEIHKHARAGRLPLAASQELMAEANEIVAALRGKLDRERIPFVETVREAEEPAKEEPTPQPRPRAEPARPRRSVMEILLDPRSIQWLLAIGGVLLVLGLVIFLAASGFFENPLHVAVVLGGGNLLLLAGGWATVLRSRYQLAGRALTLLACLTMPLNLWFYSAQGLITIEGGGLWIPALIICVLYAVSARVLKDPTFVYTLVAGVVLTGLLILADHNPANFWQITIPSSMLVILGLICIHLERAFPPDEGPFSRQRFGLAFFWSGQASLAAGLLLLLGAQLAGGPLYPLFKSWYDFWEAGPSPVVTTTGGKLLALVLVLLGTYAYLYSDVVVRRIGVYLSLAVGTLLWAEVLLISLVPWPMDIMEVTILALAVTGLVVNLALRSMGDTHQRLTRSAGPLALLLSVVPVLLGVYLYFLAVPGILPTAYRLTWTYVAVMAATAVSCRVAAHLHRGERGLETVYLFGTGAALLVGLVGLLVALNRDLQWHHRAPVVMLLPIVYLVAARASRGQSREKALTWVAHTGAVVMLLSSLSTAFQGFVEVRGAPLNLFLALFFAEAAVFYALEAAFRREGVLNIEGAGVYATAVMAAAAIWQVLAYWGVPTEGYILGFSGLGLVLLLCYRFMVLEKFQTSQLSAGAFWAGNALLLLGSAAGALRALSELGVERYGVPAALGQALLLPGVLTLFSLLGLVLVRETNWRRIYVVSSITQAGLTVLTLAVLSSLTFWQKVEIVTVLLGLLLLLTGHIGFFREQERQGDLTTFSLVLGCLLAGYPLTNATLYCRLYWTQLDSFHSLNEIGMLVVGLGLLASGYLFQIKSTTLTGAVLTALWLITLVLYARLPERLQTTAIYLMIGGAAFFAVGLALSVYRDRLLTLPDRIKRREGVFRVLSWR